MISTHHKKSVMIGLWSITLLLWGHHFTRMGIEFPESHIGGLLVCSPEYNPGFDGMSELEVEESRNTYYGEIKEALAASADTDARVLAVTALNRVDVANRIDELAELIDQYPDNRLANLHFLNACAETAEHPACDKNSVERANAVNGDNAVSWSLLAVYRADREDIFGIDSAMAQAANAADFNDYFGAQLRILGDAIPAADEFLQIALTRALAAGSRLIFNNGSRVATLCHTDAPLRSGLLQACLDFGERMQQESQAMIMTMLGRSIQETAHRDLGNIEAATRLEQETLAFNRNRSALDSPRGQFKRLRLLMRYDADLTRYWFDNLVEFGEVFAIPNTLTEAKRLSADPDYAPCRSPGPRIYYL